MPKVTKKARLLCKLRSLVEERLIRRAIRVLDSDEDSDDDEMDAAAVRLYLASDEQRYLFRNYKYRVSQYNRFAEDLSEGKDEDDLPWLTDSEFLRKYRVTKDSFRRLLNLIDGHDIFKSKQERGRYQRPVAYQLMVFLFYIGTEGSGANNAGQRNTFAISQGVAQNYRERVTTALLALSDKYLYWPDMEERRKIAFEINVLYNFPHCVAIADGTLFPLAFEPETVDAPDYSGRKYGYSLSTLIVCDHKRRIRHFLAGYPGSAHDNRIFSESQLAANPLSFFDLNEYLLGDSAFENRWFVVSSFKKLPKQELRWNEQRFNDKLASLRVISEHCIGMLKGRFPWLRSIRMRITSDNNSIKKILRLIKATIVLHNILIKFGEDEVTEDWIDHDDFSDLDDWERVPYEDGDVLNSQLPLHARKDERRQQLLRYFEEHIWLHRRFNGEQTNTGTIG